MKIFLDTANLEEIRQGVALGVVDGITTNPTLVAKEGKPFREHILDICGIVKDGVVNAEVVSTDYDAAESLVRITIEDNGCGIPAEDLDKIFTLFVSHKGGRGTGLGLPVSLKILKEHGGDIRATSQVGKGSRFTLELPAVLPPAADQAAVQDTSAGQIPKA